MNYEEFIKMLENSKDTEEVLIKLYNYFKDNVSYDYDELQVVKYDHRDNTPLEDIEKISKEHNTDSSIDFKEYLMSLLDEAFIRMEGRGLSEKNKREWFKDYGTIIHHDAVPERNGIFKIPAREAYDEIVHMKPYHYDAEYNNGLLVRGVCSHYADWIHDICNDLGIKCLTVRGVGTTSHRWNMIFIPEKNEWVNFDMTMVRFYLDGWATNYGMPQEWIMASIERMFEMQPSRVIDEILKDNSVIFNTAITSDNKNQLDSFLNELNANNNIKKG